MASVFVLQHVHAREDGVEDVKFIGVYSTREKADAAAARLGRRPGFSDASDGFHVDEYRVDQDHWVEGYVVATGAETRQLQEQIMPLTNGRKRGDNTTYVVLMPEICGQHLVVLSINDKSGGWAIRDFLTNSILEDERSSRSRHEIESKVSHEEFLPFYNVEDELHFSAWEIYLALRTSAYLRKDSPGYDTSSPNTSYGEWMPIPRRGPWRPVKL